jgi:hypothetical protein
MKADLSRNTFRPHQHYRDVLKQQGRVDLDADWNEQQAINVHRTETEAVDVIGRTGAPLHAAGFAITADGVTLRIGAGRFYVDGILAENDQDNLAYTEQPYRIDQIAVLDELKKANATTGIVYLDVWLRHITSLNDPLIREVALGGPDTTTRTQVVWQVRLLPISIRRPDRDRLARAIARRTELQGQLSSVMASGGDISGIVRELARVNEDLAVLNAENTNEPLTCKSSVAGWDQLVAIAAGRLNARTSPTPAVTDLCELPPRAGYQRTENQLYRVEVHQGGALGQATFKWSRDNGSVATAIESVSGQEVVVQNIGYDEVLGFAANQWVEIVDDATELGGRPGQLIQIEHVPSGSRSVIMKTTPPAVERELHPTLRRWEQSGASAGANGVPITGGWQPLEDGVEVQFSSGPFRTGDYWLIPARVATGEVEWPPFDIPNHSPLPQPPRGVEHHFSRLALVQWENEKLSVTADCRNIFPPLTEITGSPTVSTAMHIRKISWENDAPLPLKAFLDKGLLFDFDRVPDTASLSAETIIVTLELPIGGESGLTSAAVSRDVAPRLSVVLFGEIMLNGSQLQWLPVSSSVQSLAIFFRGLQQVLARVKLKGAAIWSRDHDDFIYLDGRVVGVPVIGENGVTHTRLVLPSGSGHRSSDFESWFALTLPSALGGFVIAPPNVRLLQRGNNFIFISPDTGGVVEVVGTITLTAAAATEVVISLKATENRAAVVIPASVTIPAGEISAKFPINPGRPTDGAARVTITSSTAGVELSATLSLTRG